MGAMAVELESRLMAQIANARAAWAETAEIFYLDNKIVLASCSMLQRTATR